MIRSIPISVCGLPSCVGMKQACTAVLRGHEAGLHVPAGPGCDRLLLEGPRGDRTGEAHRRTGRELFQTLFLTGRETLQHLQGRRLALDREAEVHVDDIAFVFDAHELADMQHRGTAEAEVDRLLRGLGRRQRGRRGRIGDGKAAARPLRRLFAFGVQCDVLPRRENGLRFGRLAFSGFRVEHQGTVLGGRIRVACQLVGVKEGIEFREAHARLHLEKHHRGFLA
jgi:hypothetical protein